MLLREKKLTSFLWASSGPSRKASSHPRFTGTALAEDLKHVVSACLHLLLPQAER